MTEPGALTTDLGGEPEDRGELHVDWDVGIPMDDGVVLRCDVFRPVGEHDPMPVLLTHGPYAKGLAFQDGFPRQWGHMAREAPGALAGSSNAYQNWETPDPEKWVPDGYVCVRVDSRGVGSSPGVLDVWSRQETEDMYRCIEWASAQAWCSGMVGLCGISYYAMNQWQVAGLRPPHLAAMAPWEGSSDFYRELFTHGGMRSHFVSRWYPRQVLSVQHGRGDRVPPNPFTGRPVAGQLTMSDEDLAVNRRDIAADAAAHPFDDAWHRERTPDLEQIEVPILSAGNWGGAGLHLRGNFEGFRRASSSQKWLEVHGGTHFTEYYTDYGRLLQKRFFDHFLKEKDNGWEKEPRVRLQVRHADGRFVERQEQEWPLARTEWTRWYLDPGLMELRRDAPAAGSATFRATGEGLTFWLPAEDRPVELTGPSSATLWVSSSTVDADIFVIYRLFDPDGEEIVFQGANDPHAPIGQGWLRASHREIDDACSLPYRPHHRHDRAVPLEPGRATALEVEVWPTSIVVLPGYRLAVTVRGTDYHYGGDISEEYRAMDYFGCAHFVHQDPADRPAVVFDNEITVHAGADCPSSLLLPVIPS
ncbi:MAG: CocE/NonD family hydrolase [Acidimicrobiales bacterium]